MKYTVLEHAAARLTYFATPIQAWARFISSHPAPVISAILTLNNKKACLSGTILSNINIEIFLCSVKLNRAERAKISISPMLVPVSYSRKVFMTLTFGLWRKRL